MYIIKGVNGRFQPAEFMSRSDSSVFLSGKLGNSRRPVGIRTGNRKVVGWTSGSKYSEFFRVSPTQSRRIMCLPTYRSIGLIGKYYLNDLHALAQTASGCFRWRVCLNIQRDRTEGGLCLNWPFTLCFLLVGKFGKIVRVRQICRIGVKMLSFVLSLFCTFLDISRFFSV